MKNIKLVVADWEKVSLSPEQRERNEERAYDNGAEVLCCCCGKEIKDLSKKHSLHLIEGGEYWTESTETINECTGSDMGWFYVGNTCYNKFKKNRYEVEIVNEDE